MPAVAGFAQLQPSFILGTNQWVCAVAEQMVGAEMTGLISSATTFRSIRCRGRRVLWSRGSRSCVRPVFENPASPGTDDSGSTLVDPPVTINMSCLEGSGQPRRLRGYEVVSYEINQMELAIEFKKIAIRIQFWEQFFGGSAANGFRDCRS